MNADQTQASATLGRLEAGLQAAMTSEEKIAESPISEESLETDGSKTSREGSVKDSLPALSYEPTISKASGDI